jgi:hypothetical protein
MEQLEQRALLRPAVGAAGTGMLREGASDEVRDTDVGVSMMYDRC